MSGAKKILPLMPAKGEEPFVAQWYPTDMMLPASSECVLLAWVRRPGEEPTMRTGCFSEREGCWLLSGMKKPKTQPTHWRALPKFL